jgi:CelD/BcsL family acetyltransferase involved in cellulose biosynthesis
MRIRHFFGQKSDCEEAESIHELPQLKKIADEWNMLAKQFNTPLLLSEWFVACAETLHAKDQLSVLTIRSNGKLSAIAPMVMSKKGGVKYLELLGSSALREPSGFIYSGENPLRRLICSLLDKRRPIILRRLDAESLQPRLLGQLCRGRAFCLFRQAANSLYFEIDPDWKGFDESILRRRLKRLHRKERVAERNGKVDYEVISPTMKQLNRYLQELFKVEHASWKGRNGTSILSQPEMEQFLLLYSQAAVPEDKLRLFFMRIDKEAVAARLAVLHANRLWEIKIGYDERFSKCSPGLLLTHETIRYAFEQGLDAYEFLGDEEAWEHLWTEHIHPYVTVHIYPYSVSGIIAIGTDILRLIWKKAIRSLGALFGLMKNLSVRMKKR